LIGTHLNNEKSSANNTIIIYTTKKFDTHSTKEVSYTAAGHYPQIV